MAFALNHISVPALRFDTFLSLAQKLDCVGVEFRNDLSGALFNGVSPEDVRLVAKRTGLRILALAEVKAFNAMSNQTLAQARNLMETARACGAEAVSLIPRNDGQRLAPKERRDDLRLALRELEPLLSEFNLIGLIEPLGFETSTLRHKAQVIDDITASGTNRFKLIHDTFHHHLAGGGPVFAAQTGLVHISGVAKDLGPQQMTDAHRILVDQNDQLGNVDQLRTLETDGYKGPISMEAFAESVHNLSDPQAQLARSFNFISQSLAARAA